MQNCARDSSLKNKRLNIAARDFLDKIGTKSRIRNTNRFAI